MDGLVNDDKPLMQSSVSSEIWNLMKTDPEEFKRRVKEYFALGYPGFTVTHANYATRTILLRDDRESTLEPKC